MNPILIIIIGGFIALLIIVAIFLLLKQLKPSTPAEVEEVEEIEEEEILPFKVEEESEQKCPEKVKKELLKRQEKIEKEAYKVYLVITNLFKGKDVPPEVKKELDSFIRTYNRIKELKEEIKVYPFSDCEKVFDLKFYFYENLIKETAEKLIFFARQLN